MHMMHSHGTIWPMIIMVVFWMALISIGIMLVVNFMNGSTPKKEKTPLQILQERFAKGEIDASEYERMKNVLKQDYKK